MGSGGDSLKAAYIGIDLLYPALSALRETGAEILKIFTCETDNKTEFNTEVCRDAETHGTPLQKTRIREARSETCIITA